MAETRPPKLTYTQQQVQWWLRTRTTRTADELAEQTGRALGAVLSDLAGLQQHGLASCAIVPGSSLWWLTEPKEV